MTSEVKVNIFFKFLHLYTDLRDLHLVNGLEVAQSEQRQSPAREISGSILASVKTFFPRRNLCEVNFRESNSVRSL